MSYGNASGVVGEFDLALLAPKSLFVTRPALGNYIATREDFESNARDVFDVLSNGHVKIAPPTKYKLEDAHQAHSDLQGRKTTGALVLIP